jgi:putative peptidoglycan lipid II flippase
MPGKLALAVGFLRLMAPYAAVVMLVAASSAVLHGAGRFAGAAAATLVFNLALIAAIVVASTLKAPDELFGVALGVSLAGLAQLALVRVAEVRAGLWRRARVRLEREALRLVGRVVMAAVATGAYPLAILVAAAAASNLGEAAVSAVYFADRFVRLPLGVFAVAVATVALPRLSIEVAQADDAAWQTTLADRSELVLAFTLPAAGGLFVLAEPIAFALLRHGNMDATGASLAAEALRGLAFGLPGAALGRLAVQAAFVRGLAARGLFGTLAAIAFGALVAPRFGDAMGVFGVGLAASAALWLQALLHLVGQGTSARLWGRVARRSLSDLGAAIAMGVGLVVVSTHFDLGSDTLAGRVGGLALLVALGVALSLASGTLLGSRIVREISKFFAVRAPRSGKPCEKPKE